MLRALRELTLSHDVQGAVSRVAAIAAPMSQQTEELCELLGHIVGEGSVVSRKVGFDLVVRLFAEGHWKPTALRKGLQGFQDVCDDLKCDVPALPKILREELRPALEPLAKNGLVSTRELDALLDSDSH
jgi:hypothetical protein